MTEHGCHTALSVHNLHCGEFKSCVLRIPAVIGYAVEEQSCSQDSLLANLHLACKRGKNYA